ncbi:MAG: peptidoglycan recognition protein family protein [Stackebrandtia sp.]
MASKPRIGRRTVIAGAAGVAAAAAATPFLVRSAFADDAQVQAPAIDDCATWGAAPPNGTIDTINNPPSFIVVHHAVTANTEDFTREQAHAHARQVQDIHQGGNGWTDTGYHFVISRGGFITEGRHGSLETLNGGTSFVMGAHASGVNDVSIGFCFEGNYEEATTVPDAQWNSLVELVTYARSQYGIPNEEIYGHRDHGSTACPGTTVYNRLPELRG